MKIQDIISYLEILAPSSLQESYDNTGLLTGNADWKCSGIITTLDVTEAVVAEAIENNYNLIVAHHPIIFSGLKKLTGKNYVEKTVIKAIKNDIAIYAIHTNLDNVIDGVNGAMADKLGLINRNILRPKKGVLKKLVIFVPTADSENLQNSLFNAGAGNIGKYSECSFSLEGKGMFKAGANTNPFVGKIGERHTENEIRVEVIYPDWNEKVILQAMHTAHPYEEVAHDIYLLDNKLQDVGSGLFGELSEAISEMEFLFKLKNAFNLSLIRYTPLLGKQVKKIALCGGAGSSLINDAVESGANFYITGDVKYHEFFDANDKVVIADIGHYESEQYTIDLLFNNLSKKFPNFAVLKTRVKTNPVNYYV